jgi:rsbT antagonist protein RsbS
VKVPILEQGPFLIATVLSALEDDELVELRRAVVERVGRCRARGVIFDLTALDVMDSFACRTLRDIASMIRLRGARTVIVGVQPEVAFAMVQLGLTLDNVETALDLEEGLACMSAKPAAMQGHGAP